MNDKIVILTTVNNFDLYKLTSKFFPVGVDKYIIDGRNGMYGIDSLMYMFNKLRRKNIDWVVMIDEDVVIEEASVLFSLVEKMKKEYITVCGVRDGGVIAHRTFNPHMVNTFFTILNFKEIAEIWNKRTVLNNQYALNNEFELDKALLKYKFDELSLYEPYYCFFLWLKRIGKKFLYLESDLLEDKITNGVLFENKIFLYHTWYARSYGVNEKHTKRIDNIIDRKTIKQKENVSEKIVIFKDYFFGLKQILKCYYKKVVNLHVIIF